MIDLSIIIPVYNESSKISTDITACSDFANRNKFSCEIIVVDDGSTDTTAKQSNSVQIPAGINLKVITLKHKGKGHAVRTGILKSSGKLVMFVDSGACIPLDCALEGIKQIKNNNCDIAIGSRKGPDSIIVQKQSTLRRLYSWGFYCLIKIWFSELGHLSDTQCGFKIYQGDIARKLFKISRINGFMFDIEILAMAIQKDYKIYNFPVKWTCDLDTRLTPARNLKIILQDLRSISKRIHHCSK